MAVNVRFFIEEDYFSVMSREEFDRRQPFFLTGARGRSYRGGGFIRIQPGGITVKEGLERAFGLVRISFRKRNLAKAVKGGGRIRGIGEFRGNTTRKFPAPS